MSRKINCNFQNVLNAIQSAVIVVDKNKKIIEMNNFARRVYRNPSVIGKSCSEIFSCCEKRTEGCPVDNIDNISTDDIIKLRQKIKINTHEEDVKCRIIPSELEGETDEMVFLHMILDRDLLAREKLIELEKNLTISTLTAGIAHEFNNMNAGIYGLVELMLSQEKLSDDTVQDMGTILKIIKKSSNLIDQLLIFANKKPSKHLLVNLNTIVNDCVKILRPELETYGINVDLVRKNRIEDMFLDANKISLAIMNIIINARDAMLESNQKNITVEIGKDDSWGYVKIKDTGVGIPAELVDRVFEPFYTTKGPLGGSSIPGTGLGLSVAAGVIKDHKGIIEVESEFGNGSTFIIRLPINSFDSFNTDMMQTDNEFDFSGSRILVVDDEVELNNLLTRALNSKNAYAESVYNGAGALEHIGRDSFDLILLDIQMPDLNGWDVIERLRYEKRRPKIIIISGHLIMVDSDKLKLVEKIMLKPFDLDELFSSIYEVLNINTKKTTLIKKHA